MRKSSSMPLMPLTCDTADVQRQTPKAVNKAVTKAVNKAVTRSSRSASANSLPLLATLAAHDHHHPVPVGGKDAWAIGKAYPVVPVNNLFKCGPVHAFPKSLLHSSLSDHEHGKEEENDDDVRDVALCLASPVVEEEPKREARELERFVRRLSCMGNDLSRRRKWAEVLRRNNARP